MEGKSPYQLLQEYEQKITDSLAKSLDKNDRIVGGGLVQSIIAKTRIFGQSIVLEVYMEDYWKYVDGGRKAGSKMPPQKAMLSHIAMRGERWNPVAQQISKFTKNKKGLNVARKKPLSMDKARKSLAFLIGRSISKHGIKPTNFVEEGMAGIEAQLEKDLYEVVGRKIEVDITTHGNND